MNSRLKLALSAASLVLVSSFALAAYAETAPTPAMPSQAPAAAVGQPVSQVQNPGKTLVGAKVKDSKGEAIGEVKSVKLGPDGKVASVDVNVGTRTVAIEAKSLTYAQADNTLTTTKTKAEIQATP